MSEPNPEQVTQSQTRKRPDTSGMPNALMGFAAFARRYDHVYERLAKRMTPQGIIENDPTGTAVANLLKAAIELDKVLDEQEAIYIDKLMARQAKEGQP